MAIFSCSLMTDGALTSSQRYPGGPSWAGTLMVSLVVELGPAILSVRVLASEGVLPPFFFFDMARLCERVGLDSSGRGIGTIDQSGSDAVGH